MKINEIIVEAGLIGKIGSVVGKAVSGAKTLKSIGNMIGKEYRRGQNAAASAMSFSGDADPDDDEQTETPDHKIKQSLISLSKGNKVMLGDQHVAKMLRDKIKSGNQKVNVDTQQAIAVLDKVSKNQQLDQNDISVLSQLSNNF
jgi:hypothetical protein